MLHLLKIDLKKLTNYRTFWVVGGLYFFTLGFGAASGMEFLKLLARLVEGLGEKLNISRIPLYHFPDVWTNLIWHFGLLKIVLAIMVVISITNEFTYRTLRQNVIDGLSRAEFLTSKILTNILFSVVSVLMIFVIGLVTGLIYSPSVEFATVTTDLEFFLPYFLEILFFLSFALMLGIFVQRSGLTIILLMLAQLIELIITSNLDDHVPGLIPFFPMRSIWNLMEWPLERYAFQEVRDYIELKGVLIVVGWIVIFNYLSYLKLKKADI
jgi:ABC-type transport system involved in multi-copper enzyme maturation permease subunit